jgi:hypothetical protein
MQRSVDAAFDELYDLQSQFPDVVVLADEGVADEWVIKAELALGVRLPASFRLFATRHGLALINKNELNGLLGVEFDDAVGPDIVFATRAERSVCGTPPYPVLLMDYDGDLKYFLDAARMDDSNECPVVQWEIQAPQQYDDYAPNFAEFLVKMCKFYLEA